MEDCSHAATPLVAHHGSHADSGAACRLRAVSFDRWWDACDADPDACAFTGSHEDTLPNSHSWRCELACERDVLSPHRYDLRNTEQSAHPDDLLPRSPDQLLRDPGAAPGR